MRADVSEIEQYDYVLPAELIAQDPLANRSDARLMLVERGQDRIGHQYIRDLPELLSPHDVLVVNDTRVVPARLIGRRVETGGRWEGLFLRTDGERCWSILCKTRGKQKAGDLVTLVNCQSKDDVRLRLIHRREGGAWIVMVESEEETFQLLDRVGRVPLPHYIRRAEMHEADRRRYQTIYADQPGAVAAPTAGLHFTQALLQKIVKQGTTVVGCTLHVGLGTFRPIATQSLADHVMHSEWGRIEARSVEKIQQCREKGGRVIAVGTTTMRVLESAAADGKLKAWEGWTDLFIRPGYEFRTVEGLMTNFHLPKSTLLVLVRTFGGDGLIRRAYEAAIAEQYRFYSYGDAMLIV